MQRYKPLVALLPTTFVLSVLFWYIRPIAYSQGEFPIITQLTNQHAGEAFAIPSGFTKRLFALFDPGIPPDLPVGAEPRKRINSTCRW